MPAAMALARDFADGDQRVVMNYKKLIDDGFKMDLAEGLQLEQERSNAFWASVPADHFEQAKANASTRARQQKA